LLAASAKATANLPKEIRTEQANGRNGNQQWGEQKEEDDL
jgi:hypothetical protein